MSSNNQTNDLIKWGVVVLDFLVMNALLYAFLRVRHIWDLWPYGQRITLVLVCNLALMVAQTRFSTVIHLRVVTITEILQRIIGLTVTHFLVAYLILKAIDIHLPAGKMLAMFGTLYFIVLMFLRFVERWTVKKYRLAGRNNRVVTFVGNDPELAEIYRKLIGDPTRGYRFNGYYADGDMGELEDGVQLERKGTVEELLRRMHNGEDLSLGEEVYVCLSRRERDIIRRISRYCDQHVTQFYFVRVSVETLGISLKREMLDDMEVYTAYENPLQNPVNKSVKRAFDILLSSLFLLCTMPFLPIIALIIKLQSPGPIFFRQLRTGLDGKDFYCYKFRSMHVNRDADRVQATKDDPRKYAFGNFMRKANIDELPQFWNVLKGDMSIVGPRPHMLAHTEQYSQLIDKYMVRHFVKPGVTGWAQVTGYRGETKELWQMEGRVKRDIWYMENWSLWLDIRIIWLTAKSMIVHDEHAY